MTKPRVCIVGAGASGLVAIKECLAEGLSPICYEMDSEVGGTWHRSLDSNLATSPLVWDNLITNTPKASTCFSDFPHDPDQTPYISWKTLNSYYNRYADHFKLRSAIQLNRRVVKICRTSDHDKTGRWEVTVVLHDRKQICSAQPEFPESQPVMSWVEIFDAVFVCSGYFRLPKYPEIQGMDKFTGKVLHSYNYTHSTQFTGQKVLVVGNGFSAIDIADDIGNSASKVILAVGGGCWIMPRLVRGRPLMDVINRHMVYSPHGEALINDRIIALSQERLDHEAMGIRPSLPPLNTPQGISDGIQVKIMSGKIQVFGHLQTLGNDTAHFSEGNTVTGIDAVVYCTGFKPCLSFIEDDILQENGKLELYRMMYPLNRTHNTLVFIGQLGLDSSFPPVAELQSRLASKVLTNKIKLPSQDQMKVDVDWNNDYNLMRKNSYSYFLPCFKMIDTLAQDIGVYPSFWKLVFRDPCLAFRVWYGPLVSAQFRLLGPGSDWAKAKQVCEQAHHNMLDGHYRNKSLPRLARMDVRNDRRRRAFTCSTMILLPLIAMAAFWIYKKKQS